MVALVAILIWRLPVYVVLPFFLVFLAIDGVYTTAVLTKVPDGAWFTLLLAAILASIHILWRFGKEAQWTAESLDRLPASSLLTAATLPTHPTDPADARPAQTTPSQQSPTIIHLSQPFGSLPITTVPGLGIFFDKTGDPAVLPPSFVHFVRRFAARPAVLIFFHMRPLPVPSVPLGERFVVTRRSSAAAATGEGSSAGSSDVKPCGGAGGTVPLLPDTYSVVMRHGYADDVLRPGLARELVAQIELAVSARSGAGAGAAELRALRSAVEAQTVYVLGKEAMRIKRRVGAEKKGAGEVVGDVVRRVLLGTFLWIRENSRTKLADLDIDVDKLVEVGFVKEI
jgi:KUP system potassium uptake protein